jgi:hypothetical protein
MDNSSLAEKRQDFKQLSWVKINIPARARVLYMDKLNDLVSMAQEVEILLPRNSRMHIKSIVIRSGVTYVECDLMV